MKKPLLSLFFLSAISCFCMAQAEDQKEWTILFDGKTMNGWKVYQDRACNSWNIVDQTLHCLPNGKADKRADLITINQYADFELSLEWKIAQGGNSGIMYRVSEKYGAPYLTGPEYQLIDDFGYPEPLTPLQKTGADYDMTAVSASPVKLAGEWNTTLIVVKGKHVEHWLNGSKLFEFEQFSPDWKKRKANSKWKHVKSYARMKEGHICLQDHGDEVWFRNIRIR